MTGEVDLERLLEALGPVLHDAPHGYVPVTPQTGPPLGWLALVREDEGTFAIAPAEDGEWARISFSVHSALAAVGLTAAVSAALARAGISANMIAGHYHDHVLVPWDRREEAMRLLCRLGAQS